MATESFAKETAIVVAMNRITGVRTFHHSNTWFWLSLSLLYRLAVMATVTTTMYCNYQTLDKAEYNYISCVMYMFMSIFAVACAHTMLVLGWVYYKDMSQLRKNIAETDRKLMKMNVVVDHRTVSFFIVIVGVFYVINGFQCFFLYLYDWYVRGFNINYFLGNLTFDALLNIGGMVLVDFATHVCWLRERFKQTNDLLKKFFIEECQIETEEWKNNTLSSWLERFLNDWGVERISCRNKIIPYNDTQIMTRQLYPVNKISMLQQIRYVHLQLCLITKSLKKIFNTQLMCHSSLTTLNFVGSLYYTYTQWTSTSTHRLEHWFICMTMIDALYVWLKVVAVCLLCENTAKEAKQVAQILQVCSINNTDFELQHELIQFSVQISLSELNNKKPRLFPLDYMFIVQSIGAMFTYFLVMIQWNQALNLMSSFSSNSTLTNPSSYNDTILTDQLIENQTLI